MNISRPGSPPPVEQSVTSVAVEVSAVLRRMRGLNSDGILQALSDAGKDSTWFAQELSRLYEGTAELYYRTKLLSMISDLVKQCEGQRIHVDTMSGLPNDKLAEMESAVVNQLRSMAKESGLAQEISEALGMPAGPRRLGEGQAGGEGPGSAGCIYTAQDSVGEGEERAGDPSAVPPHAVSGTVSSKRRKTAYTKGG